MHDAKYYTELPSPLGELVLTSDGKYLTSISLPKQSFYEPNQVGDDTSTPFKEVILQLNAYFDRKSCKFDLPIKLFGTAFQKKVWKALLTIPYGETRSYQQVAEMIGKPSSARAVGAACSKNPIGIVVPCHRVIAASGELTGYAGGIDAKKWLLDHEVVTV